MRQVGPLVVGDWLVLNDCVFSERVTIEVAATVVSARATTFAAGVHVRVRWAEVALDYADFARPSTLSGATTWDQMPDLTAACIVDSRRIELQPRPRLVTLRGAHVAELSLSDVDLRACRFFGVHGLESLSIEASCIWPHTPPTHYSDRETIAEEHHCHGSSWELPCTQPPQWLEGRDGTEPLRPAQVAALYRALRKAREDDNDQAGAGDLYYGEMEMRRKTSLPKRGQRGQRGRVRARSDRAILTAYWLLSGYGLKASRAFITLVIAIMLASLGLDAWASHPTRHTAVRCCTASRAPSACSACQTPLAWTSPTRANAYRSRCASLGPCSSAWRCSRSARASNAERVGARIVSFIHARGAWSWGSRDPLRTRMLSDTEMSAETTSLCLAAAADLT